MDNYSKAKADVLNEMVDCNERMNLLINCLDINDRLGDMDLTDQITTMIKAQQMMTDVIARATKINGQ